MCLVNVTQGLLGESSIFWVVTPCSLVDRNWHFGETCSSVWWALRQRSYTASHLKRLLLSHLACVCVHSPDCLNLFCLCTVWSGLFTFILPIQYFVLWFTCRMARLVDLSEMFISTYFVYDFLAITGLSTNVYVFRVSFLSAEHRLRKRSTVFRVKNVSFIWLRVLKVMYFWIKEPIQNIIPRPHKFKQFGQVQGPLYLFHKVALFVQGRGEEETR